MTDMAAEKEGSLQSQKEEVEALSSIYGDEWCVIDEASRTFSIKISDDLTHPKYTARLQMMLPHDYPSSAPPIYQINAAWLRGLERIKLSNSLEELYLENLGESIIFLWVEKIREFLLGKSQSLKTVEHNAVRKNTEEKEEDNNEVIPGFGALKVKVDHAHESLDHASDDEIPIIKHGETITDRRSTFQPHLSRVLTPRQVTMVLNKLYENKKIASATHNIYAYRIYCEDKQTYLQDCDDDGETAAGGRLLHLLQILDVCNVMVVVSRWYGGILLGSDRFKHINNCARNILVQEACFSSQDDSPKRGANSKKQKIKKTN
ncbi:protein IMPACT isoform X2 [Hypomesus transpacificus]|uniref:protein IMPACT isoform X2 n=1 Tax=Hypomesus transpacificus TaxID=137520 RepID=UPI001F085AB1|nr:protein IMPACT isoform X2 [Hypomesus transpacificus]